MSGFSFPSSTVKMLSLTINCSAGTPPDLVKAGYAYLAKLPISICRLNLCWLANRGQQCEKRGRLQPLQRLPLPIAHLYRGRSDPEHLCLLPSFCNCSFRPFWLYASSTRLHSHRTDPISASLLQRLLTPAGNNFQNLTAFPCCGLL